MLHVMRCYVEKKQEQVHICHGAGMEDANKVNKLGWARSISKHVMFMASGRMEEASPWCCVPRSRRSGATMCKREQQQKHPAVKKWMQFTVTGWRWTKKMKSRISGQSEFIR